MRKKISLGERIFQICNYSIIIFLIVVCLYPFWHTVMASFSDGNALSAHRGFIFKPVGFSLGGYRHVFQEKTIWTGYRNSFFLLIVGVPLSLALTAASAYLLSRKNLLLKKYYLWFIMITMYISGGTIPFYLTLVDLNLTGHLIDLIIPFCLSTWDTFILKTQFEAVPQELCDAARIDGAGHMRILGTVVVPLSKAALAVIAMYYGLGYWNAWFWAAILVRKTELHPLQLVLRRLILTEVEPEIASRMASTENVRYATMVVSIIPILLAYPFMQKHFAKGVLIGSIKG